MPMRYLPGCAMQTNCVGERPHTEFASGFSLGCNNVRRAMHKLDSTFQTKI